MVGKKEIKEIMKNSNIRAFIKGAPIVFIIFIVGLFGINQAGVFFETRNERALQAAREEQEFSDFVQYIDVQPTKNEFKVGEQITFISTLRSNGRYPVQFIDKITCPREPRTLTRRASAESFIRDSSWEVNTVQWTFGNYSKDTEFIPITIKEPKKNCSSEHFISIEVAPGEFETEIFEPNNSFAIVE